MGFIRRLLARKVSPLGKRCDNCKQFFQNGGVVHRVSHFCGHRLCEGCILTLLNNAKLYGMPALCPKCGILDMIFHPAPSYVCADCRGVLDPDLLSHCLDSAIKKVLQSGVQLRPFLDSPNVSDRRCTQTCPECGGRCCAFKHIVEVYRCANSKCGHLFCINRIGEEAVPPASVGDSVTIHTSHIITGFIHRECELCLDTFYTPIIDRQKGIADRDKLCPYCSTRSAFL